LSRLADGWNTPIKTIKGKLFILKNVGANVINSLSLTKLETAFNIVFDNEGESFMGKTVDPQLILRYKKEQVLDLAKRSLTSVLAHFALFVFVAVITP